MRALKPPVPIEVTEDRHDPVLGSARSRFEAEVEAEIDALMVVPREIEDEVLADVRDDLLRRELATYLAGIKKYAPHPLVRDTVMGLRRSLEFAAHVNVCKRWNERAMDAYSEPGERGGPEHPGVQFNDPNY